MIEMTSPIAHFPRPAPVPKPEKLLFADFELRLDHHELFRNSQLIKLQDQPARLLELLASHPARVLGRDDIRRHLWGDAVNVDFDQGINFSIKQIRRALDDSASQPRFIETLPRKGYRFVAPVRRTTIADDELTLPRAATVDANTVDAATATKKAAPGIILLEIVALTVIVLTILLVTTRFSDRQTASARLTVDDLPAAAREAYLEGVFLLEQDLARPRAALASLERAQALAPDFAPIHVQVSKAAMMLPGGAALMETAARRAVELAPELAEAHLALGQFHFYRAFDSDAAGQAYRRALELDPKLASAHHKYAGWLSSRGRHDGAIAAAERARSLDPGSLLLAVDVGLFAYYARRWDQAIAESRRVLALDPNYPWAHRWIIYTALARGQVSLALAQARTEVESAVAAGQGTPEREIDGLDAYWRWRLDLWKGADNAAQIPPTQLAFFHLGLNEPQRALEALERSCEEPAGWRAPYLAVDPFFDPIRSEPRFRSVLECLGLTEINASGAIRIVPALAPDQRRGRAARKPRSAILLVGGP